MLFAILLIAAVQPPRSDGELGAPYPEGAHGNETVQLELEIDTAGQVKSAHATAGQSPFAAAAERAAASWKFEPARRDGVAVPAKVKLAVEFHEPMPVSEDEVRVRGSLEAPGQTRLGAGEAREIPGGMGDPVRAITALPGAIPARADDPYLYVRGAPPNDSGFFVDGVRVPLLFHGGVATSVIPPSLVDSIDFFPSAAPARYGGLAGGIVDLELPAPSSRLHGDAYAKAYESGALLETPVGDGSVLFAARYGYPQLELSLVSPDSHLHYWDYQQRTTWNLGDRDRLSLFAFGSHDRLGEDKQGSYVEELASDFHRLDLRWDHDFSDGDHLRVAATEGWTKQGAAPSYADDWTTAIRVETDLRLDRSLRLRAGGHVDDDAYSFSSKDPAPTNLTAGVWSDLVWQMSPSLEITPGARFDVYRSNQTDPAASGTLPAVDPRLAVRWAIAPGFTSLTSAGLAHQFPTLRFSDARSNAFALPGFAAGGVHLQESEQISQGFEVDLPADFSLTTTGFGSWTTGITDMPSDCVKTGGCAGKSITGKAYGLEILLKRPLTRHLTGWLSYTLSRATERYPDGRTVMSPFDRTHVLSAIAAYDLGDSWRAGARFTWYSGTIFSSFDKNGERAEPLGHYRLPGLFRADLRVEKRWTLDGDRSLALVSEVQNATLSREEDVLNCHGGPLTAKCQPASSIPLVVIPSVGLELTF